MRRPIPLSARLVSRVSCLVVVSVALVTGTAVPVRSAPGDTPTAAEAAAFVERAESTLLEAWIRSERAAWVQQNFITEDTETIAADAYAELMARTARLAKQSVAYDGLDLPDDVARKLRRIKLSLPLAAPADPALQSELARITTQLSSLYGKGQSCDASGTCRSLGELSKVLAESRSPDAMLDAWVGWRTVSPPMRPLYRRFVELGNLGAREMGFDDLGAMWRSGYDMDPDAFAAELDRLWEQVRPLYEALHCHVRAKLREVYGADAIPEAGPIPAHLLGNMWAQSWIEIFDLVAPEALAEGAVDVTDALRGAGVDAVEMVRIGERFFSSLGFEELPETFWERSLFTDPADRDVVCHASAWNIDWVDDLRIKMCIEVEADDFVTVHHELGHNYYQRAYASQPPLFRDSANDGFHEGLGDTLALSITPSYLEDIGLVERAPDEAGDLAYLMRTALDKVAFLPFGLLVDQWRWKVFAGDVGPDGYNRAWWDLREAYQGVAPPVPRDETGFDPGAKYHVPSNTPYTRYFLAHVLQFQFHRALCEAAGFEGPLHRCSIYGSEAAGERLAAMMEMGASRPWPVALEALTGSREMDATALLDYFEPLATWLAEQNRGRTCGW